MSRKALCEYWQEAVTEAKARAERGEPEFPTGISFLDKATDGIRRGEMWIVAGKPRSGKTILTLQMAQSFAENEEHTINYFSLEMRGSDLVTRMFSDLKNLDSEGLREGKFVKQMEEHTDWFTDYLNGIDLDISEFSGYKFEEIIEVMEKQYDDKKPDIIFIDFIQLIDKSGSPSEKVALDEYVRKLKEMAKKQNIGVVLVSQLRRLPSGADYNREPEISDLLGTGSLEQIADKVIIIYRYTDNKTNIVKHYINLAKNRQGREIKQEVILEGAYSRFKEIKYGKQEEEVKKMFGGNYE